MQFDIYSPYLSKGSLNSTIIYTKYIHKCTIDIQTHTNLNERDSEESQ